MRLGLFILRNDEVVQNAVAAILRAPTNSVVEIKTETRSAAQSALFHALCGDIVRQVKTWHGRKLTIAMLKDMLTAALHTHDIVPGLEEGTFVVLGQHTGEMSKDKFSDLIELTYMQGAKLGVTFRQPKADAMEEARRI